MRTYWRPFFRLSPAAQYDEPPKNIAAIFERIKQEDESEGSLENFVRTPPPKTPRLLEIAANLF